MRHAAVGVLVIAGVAALAPGHVDAHFVLMEPASWLVENRLGDPQKAAPCGGTSADPGMPSGVVGKAIGGSKLHLKVSKPCTTPDTTASRLR